MQNEHQHQPSGLYVVMPISNTFSARRTMMSEENVWRPWEEGRNELSGSDSALPMKMENVGNEVSDLVMPVKVEELEDVEEASETSSRPNSTRISDELQKDILDCHRVSNSGMPVKVEEPDDMEEAHETSSCHGSTCISHELQKDVLDCYESSNSRTPVVAERTKDIEAGETSSRRRSTCISDELQKDVLDCYKYMCARNGTKHGAVSETCKILKLHRNTVAKIVSQGKVVTRKRGQTPNRRIKFGRIDKFWKDLIRETVYGFYDKKIAPTMDMLLQSIKEKAAMTNRDFPYQRTTLYELVGKLGFRCSLKADNQVVIVWRAIEDEVTLQEDCYMTLQA